MTDSIGAVCHLGTGSGAARGTVKHSARRSRLTLGPTYEIPRWGFGWNNSAFGRKLFNGWMVSTVGLLQSGLPFSATDSSGAAYYGVTSSTANWAPGATLSTADLSGRTESRLNEYFDTAAFAKAGNYFGNAGRNILRGPSQRNIDLAQSKLTAIGERVKADFRGELFNATNTPNFANPNSSIESSSFGGITARLGQSAGGAVCSEVDVLSGEGAG